jgi:hypothetical protein
MRVGKCRRPAGAAGLRVSVRRSGSINLVIALHQVLTGSQFLFVSVVLQGDSHARLLVQFGSPPFSFVSSGMQPSYPAKSNALLKTVQRFTYL